MMMRFSFKSVHSQAIKPPTSALSQFFQNGANNTGGNKFICKIDPTQNNATNLFAK